MRHLSTIWSNNRLCEGPFRPHAAAFYEGREWLRITIFCIGDTTLTAEVDGTLRTSMAVLSEEGRLDVAWNRLPAVEEEDFHGDCLTSLA